VGNGPGVGKTTLARRLASKLRLENIELDAIFHQENWEHPTEDEFHRLVSEALPADGRWVVDGNYSAVAEIVASRADIIVWLDMPRWLVP